MTPVLKRHLAFYLRFADELDALQATAEAAQLDGLEDAGTVKVMAADVIASAAKETVEFLMACLDCIRDALASVGPVTKDRRSDRAIWNNMSIPFSLCPLGSQSGREIKMNVWIEPNTTDVWVGTWSVDKAYVEFVASIIGDRYRGTSSSQWSAILFREPISLPDDISADLDVTPLLTKLKQTLQGIEQSSWQRFADYPDPGTDSLAEEDIV